MIPKVIHFCWFGRGPKPELAVRCIESWKKHCADYEIIEWNEDNFDIDSVPYVKEAYNNRKFAFVTDYVRLFAMYTYGGIYMDTDVKVQKPLDQYLSHNAFSGFENSTQIPTGIMACEKGFHLFGELLAYYDDAHFCKEDGSLDMTTNVETITKMMLKRGFIPNGEYQVVDGFALYPQNVFCPDHKKLDNLKYMKDTATIHYFAGSWKSETTKKRENSWWWKIIILPLANVSHKLEAIGGQPYQRLKRKLWSSKLREKQDSQ